MPLKLNSSGGGSVTLDVPSTASDFTVTVPASSATLATTNGGNTIEFGAGTASAPPITTTGDTNTGIYFPGADRIGFTEGGTQVGEFDNGGNFRFNSGYGSVATAYGCRAWVNFKGTGTLAIRSSGNVTSVTDHGVGDYTVNFTNAMPDVNYATIAVGDGPVNTAHCIPFVASSIIRSTYSTSAVSVAWFITTNSGTRGDPFIASVAVFR